MSETIGSQFSRGAWAAEGADRELQQAHLRPPTLLGLPMVYLVDDEPVVRDALAWLLRS